MIRTSEVVLSGNLDVTLLVADSVELPRELIADNFSIRLDDEPAVPVVGGVEMPFCYGELQAEMELINRAYIEVMMAGDAKGRVFTFPIPTYNITHDFPWDSDNATRLFDMTARYGLPYFQNFLNSDMQPNQVRSMCCRLQLDVRDTQAAAIHLYESLGYKRWGVNPAYAQVDGKIISGYFYSKTIAPFFQPEKV